MSTIGPYQLNTIYSGDCRELSKAIPNESVDLVLTDPPFGIGFKYSNGYQDDPKEYRWLLHWLILESHRVVKPGGLCFVFQSMKRIRETWQMFPEESRLFAACKSFVQAGGPSRILPMFDPVIYWQKDGESLLGDWFRRDWHIAKPASFHGKRGDDFHNCSRPIDTITNMIDSFSPPMGIVCDFFMGSGTTAIAAKITGRQFIGFELDPETAEKANSRVIKTQSPLFGAAANTAMQPTLLRSASQTADGERWADL